MRALAVTAIVIVLVGFAAACGGAGEVSADDVASCLEDSGKFVAVTSGDRGQIRYAGSEGGVQATYRAAEPVQVNVLIGMDSGEASNLSSNMQASGAWVDVTRERNAVAAIPVADENAPSRSAAGDAVESCL